jgi:NADH:ubiquinone oxidoreductase subunit 4 (subunit M)
MLWMYQKVFHGTLRHEKNKGLPDLSVREWLVLAPLVVFMFWLGVAPGLVLDKIGPSLDRVLEPVAVHAAPAAGHHDDHALRLDENPAAHAGDEEVAR